MPTSIVKGGLVVSSHEAAKLVQRLCAIAMKYIPEESWEQFYDDVSALAERGAAALG
jgi:hypothetical protein